MPRLTLSYLTDPRPGDTLSDPAVEGLRYRVRGSGRVFAEIRYKGAGGWRSAPLGRVDIEGRLSDLLDEDEAVPGLEIVLEPVREKARELRRRLRKGEGGPKGITLAAALELHLGGKKRSPRTVRDYRDRVAQHFGDWLGKPLAELSREDALRRHQALTVDIGPYGANGALRVLRAVWNRARRQHPELGESPTGNVDWNPEERADRAIPLSQLPAWWRAVLALPNAVRRDFYLVTLFTGLRRRTVDCMEVGHLDLPRRTLLVPRPKGGRPFTLPLSDFLYEVLALRLLGRSYSEFTPVYRKLAITPWVFPAASASGHIEEPKVHASWKGVPFTPHGLRNTYISAATAAGVHPYHIKLLVNHAVPKGDVTAGYLGRDVDALREPQQRTTDWLLSRLRA